MSHQLFHPFTAPLPSCIQRNSTSPLCNNNNNNMSVSTAHTHTAQRTHRETPYSVLKATLYSTYIYIYIFCSHNSYIQLQTRFSGVRVMSLRREQNALQNVAAVVARKQGHPIRRRCFRVRRRYVHNIYSYIISS